MLWVVLLPYRRFSAYPIRLLFSMQSHPFFFPEKLGVYHVQHELLLLPTYYTPSVLTDLESYSYQFPFL